MENNIKERLYEIGLLILILVIIVICFNKCEYNPHPTVYKIGDERIDTMWVAYRDSFYIQGKGKIVYKPGDTVVVTKENIKYKVPFMEFTLDTLSPKQDTIKLRAEIPSGRFSMTFNGAKDSIPQITKEVTLVKEPKWYEIIVPYLEGAGFGILITWLFK